MADAEQQSFETVAAAVTNGIYDVNAGLRRARSLLQKLRRGAPAAKPAADLSDQMSQLTAQAGATSSAADALAGWPASLLGPAQRATQTQLGTQFRALLRDVQALQGEVSAAARAQQRAAAEAAAAAEAEAAAPGTGSGPGGATESTPLLQQQLQEPVLDQLDEGQLGLHTALLEDRDVEIAALQRGMVEINTIFRDIGTLVGEQGAHIDTIEENIGGLARRTEDASRELAKAENYQRSRGKWSCIALCVLLVFTILAGLSILY